MAGQHQGSSTPGNLGYGNWWLPHRKEGKIPVQHHHVSHPDEPRSLRLILQEVQSPPGHAYRLIAYGDGDCYCTPEFQTLAALLALLRRVAPDVEASLMATSEPTSSIVFAGDVALTGEQRMRLGLLAQSH